MDIDNAEVDVRNGIKKLLQKAIVGNVDLGVLLSDHVNWIAKNPNYKRVSSQKLTFTPGGDGTVMGYSFPVENYPIWTFRGKFDLSAGWQGFGMRSVDPIALAWSSNHSYIIVIKAEQIELQRFHNGGIFFDTVENTYVKSGVTHDIELGAVDIEGGVRLVFKVDGQTVFDYEDKDHFISEKGYLSLYSSTGKTLELYPAKK